jgi:ubiquinone/menaquinone biosynthesis C-methylase UbiE
MSRVSTSPIGTAEIIAMPHPTEQSRLRLRCPGCRQDFPVADPASARHSCSGCGFVISEVRGILRALAPDREQYFQQFVHQYETVRTKEGRGSSSADYYLALPFRDLTGNNSWQWHVRSRTFRHLEKHLLPSIELAYPQGCDVMDLGAGNGWMSYRMALRGHRPVAVDLLDNDADGLGAARHYIERLPNPFPCFQAEMDQLPFAAEQFDVAVFNASFHYSIDYEQTLREVLRCLRRPGQIIIADSPFYSRDESGRAMVEEKRVAFQKRFGFRSDSVPSCEYLTPEILDELAEKLSLQWNVSKPWYGIGWALRPAKARLLRRREPAKFLLLCAWVRG